MQILIDTDSTHNFIQECLAKHLNLPIEQSQHFLVNIGNGQSLNCGCICSNTVLNIQNNQFYLDLYVLPIQGADIVLGVQWLEQLGPITLYYKHLSMSFSYNNQLIHLTGETFVSPIPISHHQLKRQLLTLQKKVLFVTSIHRRKYLLDHR